MRRFGGLELFVAVAALITAQSATAALLRYEYSAAHRQLAQIRMLTERLNKENTLYQLYLDANRRHDVVATTRAIDAALELLREGAPFHGVPRPPTQAIRERLEALEEAWARVRARALTNPYRRDRAQFTVREGRGYDPAVLLYLDRAAQHVLDAADRVSDLYVEECKKDSYHGCKLDRDAGAAHLLSEQIVKDTIYLFAGVDREGTRKQLEARLEAFSSAIDPPPETRRFIDEAMADARGAAGEYVVELQQSIEQSWPSLRRGVELVMSGDAEKINLLEVVRIQRGLVDDLERLTVVMTRYALVEEGGEGLLPPD